MAKYRKLGRNSSQRKALLRGQVTALIENGKIVTTEARAKEVKKQAEKLITLAIKEKDNFETVKVSAKVPKKDANGTPMRSKRRRTTVWCLPGGRSRITLRTTAFSKPFRTVWHRSFFAALITRQASACRNSTLLCSGT